MSLIGSGFGNAPGFGTVYESFSSGYTWGPYPRYFQNAYISTAASDPTNSPTYELRMGLVMGQITASGQWTNYSPTATDGSEVARGVLPVDLRMQDVLSGVNTNKFWAVMVTGGVQAAKLIGLDLLARAQMSNRFYFDDNIAGAAQYPFQRWQNKTANYQLVASDNLSIFTTLGAGGEVDFTLPAIAAGYDFTFQNQAAQIMKVISKEGGNLIGLNSLTSTSVALSTGGQEIGGGFHVYSNNLGTKWIVEIASAGVTAVTLA